MNNLRWFPVIIFSVSLFFSTYLSDQSAFLNHILTYLFMFSSFCWIMFKRDQYSWKELVGFAIAFQLIQLPAIPWLSPDVYRFIWDGELILQGINPFAFQPNVLVTKEFFEFTPYLQELYQEMTDLSKQHYSIYPTVNQVYFVVTAFFTEHTWGAIVLLRVLMVSTYIVGFVYLKRILQLVNLDPKYVFWLALNPFILIELTGNLHFEGVMLSFLLAAFYYLFVKRWWRSALFFALAINVKLTPLIILPFLFRYLGWKISFRYYLYIGIVASGLFFMITWPSLLPNFLASLKLYFINFEFNAAVFGWLKTGLYPIYDYETILILGPFLSKLAAMTILIIALTVKRDNFMDLIKKIVYAYVIYLLLSTTVHPWYITVPLAFSILTQHSFVMIWSFTIMLSYSFYAISSTALVQLLILIEYALFLVVMGYELYTGRRLLSLTHFNRN